MNTSKAQNTKLNLSFCYSQTLSIVISRLNEYGLKNIVDLWLKIFDVLYWA